MPLWCSVGGGDQERSTDVELTAVCLRSCGEAFGSENGMKDTLIMHRLAHSYITLCIALPSSSVWTDTVALKGPLPALVCAATAAVYSVLGMAGSKV